LGIVQLALTLESDDKKHKITINHTGLNESSSHGQTIKSVSELGNPNNLGITLKMFDRQFSKAINVYERLEAKGIQDISRVLMSKTFNIGSLMNQIDSKNFLILHNILIQKFIADPEYYEFSLGILTNIIPKIYQKLTPELQKYARKLATPDIIWSAQCTVTNKSYDSIKFEDTYTESFHPAECSVHNIIQSMTRITCESIEPFADSFMTSLVTDAFKNIQRPDYSKFTKWEDDIKLLAWQLYEPNGAKRHKEEANAELYERFSQLVENVSEYLIAHGLNYRHNPYQNSSQLSFGSAPSLGLGRSISMCTEETLKGPTKCDYTKFDTYFNPHHQIWMAKQEAKAEIFNSGPVKLMARPTTFSDELIDTKSIADLEMKLERYIRIHSVCENIPSDLQHQITAETTFVDIVTIFESQIEKLIDEICMIYHNYHEYDGLL
jgi:hypothetical protein